MSNMNQEVTKFKVFDANLGYLTGFTDYPNLKPIFGKDEAALELSVGVASQLAYENSCDFV